MNIKASFFLARTSIIRGNKGTLVMTILIMTLAYVNLIFISSVFEDKYSSFTTPFFSSINSFINSLLVLIVLVSKDSINSDFIKVKISSDRRFFEQQSHLY